MNFPAKKTIIVWCTIVVGVVLGAYFHPIASIIGFLPGLALNYLWRPHE